MIKKILLRLYPAAWRKEYGEEFADVLASRPLGVRAFADVVTSALWQRLRSIPPWVMCGMFLFAVEVYRCFVPMSLPILNESDPKDVILVLTGLWIGSRKGGRLRDAAVGTAKAGVFGLIPGLFVVVVWPSVKNGVPFFFGYQTGILVSGVIVAFAYSALVGVCGALGGRMIARFRRRLA